MQFTSKTLTAVMIMLATSSFPAAAQLRAGRHLDNFSNGECYIPNGKRVYLDFKGADESNLRHCEGDCDKDSDCRDQLVCYQRDANEAVPGCVGGRADGSKSDFCVFPSHITALKFCGSSATDLGHCAGDCDTDSDCLGDLVCFQRDGAGPVPGCTGGYDDSSRTDYCVKPQDIERSPIYIAYDGSNPTETLSRCRGDCDDDSDCKGDLVCYQRDKFEAIPGCLGGRSDPSRADYCVDPRDMKEVTYIRDASSEKQVGLCEGDCDHNSDCEDDLVCYQRDAYEAVPGCAGGDHDGSRTDYCVLPANLR